MKKHLLLLTFTLLMVLTFAISCGDSESPNINNLGNKYTATSTSKKPPDGNAGVVDDPSVYNIASASLGMIPCRVESGNESVARGSLLSLNQGLKIVGVGEGSTSLTVYDDFGHYVTVDIDVASDKAVVCRDFSPFSEGNSTNVVLDMGVIANDDKDDTEPIQRAIDALATKGGGTVYIPRGVYYVKTLQIKENITLRLAGSVEDATVGYTDDVKKMVDAKEFAIFIGNAAPSSIIINFEKGGRGTDGVDNFTISGGVFDMRGKTSFMAMVCADNVRIENAILKDALYGHTMQIAGSTNVNISNVMFAGYNLGDGSKYDAAEAVQIEAATSAALGTGVVEFGNGEYYFSKDVKIDGCYFGPSDKFGPQNIAIGHHGARNMSDVDGLIISNCKFEDSVRYSIRTMSYSNVRIVSNTFVTSGKYRHEDLVDSFICVALQNKNVTVKAPYNNSNNIVTAFLSKPGSMQGTQNMDISGNSFTINGDAVKKRVIIANSNEYDLGAETVQMYKFTYGQPVAVYNGYVPIRNVIYNLSVRNNVINVNCDKSEFSDHLMSFFAIRGFSFGGNSIVVKNSAVRFSDSYNGTNGVEVSGTVVGNEMYTRTIKMKAVSGSAGVLLPNSSGATVKLTPSSALDLVLKSDGHGEIVLTYDDSGNVTVTPTPKSGYAFVGWTVQGADEAYDPKTDTKLSSSLCLVANFSR